MNSSVREAGSAGSSRSQIIFTVDDCWCERWTGRTSVVADELGFRLAGKGDAKPTAALPGTILPAFRDAHVHLGLVDGSSLLGAGIGAVHDFGWELDVARGWLSDADLPEVRIAGQLLTAPDGYPSKSGWAPPGASREVASPDEARRAVDAQLDAGAAFIKLALNADVGPVFNDDTLAAIVQHAHARGVAVAAHAQGQGQAARAFDSGVDVLAHAPWTERLSDSLIEAMAESLCWVSTLDIHGWGSFDRDFAVANDNVRRFHAVGGDIRYGTDLGNGPLPLGINERELRALEHAGLGLDALAAAIAPVPADGRLGARISHVAHPREHDDSGWLASAHLIDPNTLEEYLE